jgi:uncharacterized damage-inducible protein DinB
MSLKDALITELKRESASSRKMLERVPMEKADWKPHEKSMTLGKLASHVADIPHWISDIINIDTFDFKAHYKPFNAATQEELLGFLDEKTENAIAALEQMAEADFEKIWVVKNGEQVYFNIPKNSAIRSWGFSHMVHHRGQLSVYLRLLDVPVPGMYGPTADEGFM